MRSTEGGMVISSLPWMKRILLHEVKRTWEMSVRPFCHCNLSECAHSYWFCKTQCPVLPVREDFSVVQKSCVLYTLLITGHVFQEMLQNRTTCPPNGILLMVVSCIMFWTASNQEHRHIKPVTGMIKSTGPTLGAPSVGHVDSQSGSLLATQRTCRSDVAEVGLNVVN